VRVRTAQLVDDRSNGIAYARFIGRYDLSLPDDSEK